MIPTGFSALLPDIAFLVKGSRNRAGPEYREARREISCYRQFPLSGFRLFSEAFLYSVLIDSENPAAGMIIGLIFFIVITNEIYYSFRA